MAEVKAGDRVRVHYTGRLTDGRIFDSSDGRDPLEFTAGGSEVIDGFSRAVIGMGPGGKKTVRVPPQEGYGHHDRKLVQKVPRTMLPEEAKQGDRLQASGEDGREFSVYVLEVEAEEAVLDGNHPLAGQTLEFDLHLLEIVPA